MTTIFFSLLIFVYQSKTDNVSIDEILANAYRHAVAVQSFEVDLEYKTSAGRLSDMRIVRDGQKTFFDVRDHAVGILPAGVSLDESIEIYDGLKRLTYFEEERQLRTKTKTKPVEIVSTMVSAFFWLSKIELENLGDTGFQDRAYWNGLAEIGEIVESKSGAIVSIRFPCKKRKELSVVVDFDRELGWFPVGFQLIRQGGVNTYFECDAKWLQDERGDKVVYPVKTKMTALLAESDVAEMTVNLETLKLNPIIPDSQFTSAALPKPTDELDVDAMNSRIAAREKQQDFRLPFLTVAGAIAILACIALAIRKFRR